jgi:hypothetical protein
VLGLIVVLVYYIVAWFRVGRDPERGVIVTLFAPPQGLSPAAVRYLKRMAFDAKAFAATIVQMAVKGHLVIEEAAGVPWRRTGPGRGACVRGERIHDKLFGVEQSVAMIQKNHARSAAP